MGSMTSIGVALSGLRAAQAGLSVTGHNVSNSSVSGYTRQQIIQQDFSYVTIGSSPTGCLKLKAGLGTNVSEIRQIRNRFYDTIYRQENSYGNYYSRKYTAGDEINNIIGELQSEYKAQDTIIDVWNSLNELSKNPAAIETRSGFIQSCVSFLEKMQDINKSLFEYQMNLNEQVKQEINKINTIVEQIGVLNEKIQQVEVDGTNANDMRDERNRLIDELSGFLDIEVKEVPVADGRSSRVDILIAGSELLVNNVQQKIGLKYCNGEYPFVEPVFTTSKDILPASSNATKLFPNLDNEDLGTNSYATRGSLKALLVSRGEVIGDYTMEDERVGNYMIPKLQKKIDTLVHEVVTMLNNASTSGMGLDGKQGVPIFIRKSNVAIDEPEDPDQYGTLYTLNNLQINPDLFKENGYNNLGFSTNTGDIDDNSLIMDVIKKWKEPIDSLEGASIDGYYKKIITDFAVIVQEDREKLESKIGTIDLAENKRMTLSAVSLDEELTTMLKYQHAFNSAAKIVNVLDGMMDKVINGTGRVGV